MALTKKQRLEVFSKSGGKCWYCGCDLPEKGWHADHFHPVIRVSEIVHCPETRTYKFKQTGESLRPHHDRLENMVPSCAPCNLFKTTHSIEFFRSEIEAQIDRCRKASSGFRIAERMGLIETNPVPVEFWFEKAGLAIPPTQED